MVVIETERLLLRPIGTGDFGDYLALANEPQVAHFTLPVTRAQAVARLKATEREWAERGHGGMAILERPSGRFLGRSGLRYWPQFGETEVGWSLWPWAWGQGYATEAARAVVAWGFANLKVDYLTAMIRSDNERSLRVARRLDFTPLRDDVLLDTPVIVHALRRPEGA